MTNERVDLRQGGCMCGAARFEINLQGHRTGACHCTDCQKNSGGPYMIFTTVDAGQIRWISKPKGEGRASDIAIRRFCTKCGTPMTWESVSEPDDQAVSTGTIDDPNGLEISYEIYTRSRWASIPPIPGARQYEGSSSSY
ncbi:GFA family protein [Kordiimonas sp.]|uniref:GFA family protein n=1 Tax=Kordiimonas sp. TaxID=1970157 RepID=UPI003A9485AA